MANAPVGTVQERDEGEGDKSYWFGEKRYATRVAANRARAAEVSSRAKAKSDAEAKARADAEAKKPTTGFATPSTTPLLAGGPLDDRPTMKSKPHIGRPK